MKAVAISLLACISADPSAVASAFGIQTSTIRAARFASTSHDTTSTRSTRPTSTTLYLEDHIADLIDTELVRVGKLQEWEREWHAKNKQFIEPTLPDAAGTMLGTDLENPNKANPMQLRRDKKMADKDPQKYCADRCVATGNCEVYEDMFEMSPAQVMEFCNDCVLAEDDDAECPIPDSMYGEDDVSDLRSGASGELRP